MRRTLFLVLALTACSTDFIGPEDPDYEELCTLYVGVGEPARITRWQIEHCELVRVVVVRFGAVLSVEYVDPATLELEANDGGA